MSRGFIVTLALIVAVFVGIGLWVVLEEHSMNLNRSQPRSIADEMKILHRQFYGTKTLRELPRSREIPALISKAVKAEEKLIIRLANTQPHREVSTRLWFGTYQPIFLEIVKTKVLPVGCQLAVDKGESELKLDLWALDPRGHVSYILTLKELGPEPSSHP